MAYSQRKLWIWPQQHLFKGNGLATLSRWRWWRLSQVLLCLIYGLSVVLPGCETKNKFTLLISWDIKWDMNRRNVLFVSQRERERKNKCWVHIRSFLFLQSFESTIHLFFVFCFSLGGTLAPLTSLFWCCFVAMVTKCYCMHHRPDCTEKLSRHCCPRPLIVTALTEASSGNKIHHNIFFLLLLIQIIVPTHTFFLFKRDTVARLSHI